MKINELCLLNTRPDTDNDALTQFIQSKGGEVISMPMFEIAPITQSIEFIVNAITKAQRFIFVSKNAITQLFQHINPSNFPTHKPCYVLGQASNETLASFISNTIEHPKVSDSEHFLKLESLQSILDEIIVIFKGEAGRAMIHDVLEERGAKIIEIPLYQRTPKPDISQLLTECWHKHAINIILSTSEQSLRAFKASLPDPLWSKVSKIPLLTISERLVTIATDLGFTEIIQSSPHKLKDAIKAHTKG